MDIYDRIENILTQNTMTKAELATILDMPYTTLASLFARHSKKIGLETIRQISNYFNVTMDYLITGKEAKQEPQKPYAMKLYEALSL